MLKTLFLNPPSFDHFDSAGARFAATRKTHSLWHPVWLGYAAALTPKSKLLDCPASQINLDQLLKIAKKFQLIIIYTSTPSLNNDIKVADALKAKLPKTKIVFVGPHVSVLPAETLQTTPSIDAVARKEFDYTALELSQSKPWSKIKGLSFRRGKKIIHNPDRPLLTNLDQLPFVAKIYKRDLPVKNYHLPFCLHPYLAIYAGRGCPNQCTFCLWPQTFTGRVYRKRSVSNVIAELKWIQKNLPEIKEIFFDDDTFTINQTWVKEFCRQVKPLKLIWSINARAELDYPLLKQMREAGCRVLVVGYESGNDKILTNIKKGVTAKQALKFTKALKKAGLMVHGTFVLGMPGETKATINQTWHFACRLDCDTIQVSIATPLPGTEFYQYCRQKGYLKQNILIDQAGYQAPSVSYPHLSARQIQQEVEKFHLKYYFRPYFLKKTLKKAFSSLEEAKRIARSTWEYSKYLVKNPPL